MASLTFNHGSYYAVFSVSGSKKIWKRIGKVNRKEAKQILKRLEQEHELDRLNFNETKPITLYQYAEKYMEYCRTNKAVSTYERELPVVDHIKAFFGNVLLTKVDSQKIESYKAHRVAIGLKPRRSSFQ